MMDKVDTAYLEAAIGWLVQTILESLSTGKLEAWIRGVGLADDVERLKSEIERVEMVVAAVKGRATGNKPLARSLARLKELLYDADDAVDDLDYCRLQQQVEGALVYPERHGAEQAERPRGNADIPSRSGGKKRSEAWGHFDITEEENGKPVKARCIHCHKEVRCGSDKGTSVLHNHLKSDGCKKKRGESDQQPNTCSIADGIANGTPTATSDSSSRKRRRMNEESTHNTAANAHHRNEAEFSNRIKEITRQLQDIRGAVSEVLKLHGSDSVASSNHYRRTRSDVCPRTSSLIQRKIYGRDAEKNSIINMIATDEYDGITVLPIVGIGGVGKTALAQFVYDDLTVKSNFERIWAWVSDNFDEVRLTREMLDFVSQDRHEGFPKKKERHEGISSFAKLQEILKGHMESQSKKFLLILDDVWDNMDDYRWNKLLAPLKSSHAKGNVILVTTRILSVAQKIGTVEPIKLGALADEYFWLLFKACAFGDENYNGPVGLTNIGRQIADRLKGNPLAAETAGALLREHLTIDHWSNILKNEGWKSLQLSGGIMPALKFSYDQLPYHLQQCFSYCSIFPNKYQFLSEELIRLWIAQGYVNGGRSGKRLEEIGQDYLFDLVNSGFFQPDERKRSPLGNQTCYVMCGLMHDFAMVVSRTECATIDGLQCNEMLPTVHHLSIVTDSAYTQDRHGNILRNEKFEKKLLDVVTSVRKLRTLVLIGQCGSSFLQLFQNLFKEAQNLRVLQISTECAGLNSFLCNVANPSHLRYLKLEAGEEDGASTQVLSKFYHLQVLDAGSDTELTISNDVNNLVSLRHLVAEEDMYSSIANIGKMTSLQELHNFSVQNSSGFEITQLQSMNELVQLGMFELENVKTCEEAYGAGLPNKQHLGKLHLSWNYIWPPYKYDSEMETEDESSPMEVLEGLEPHQNLKHLQISGYDGATSPAWLANSLTSLRTLRLEGCRKLQIMPSLERLPFLRKFELRIMLKVTEVSIPSLEELVLDEMPKLERCSCTSLRDLNSSLRVLRVTGCPVLKVFPLFEDSQKFKIEQKSWLSSLGELIIHKCPQLLVPHPLMLRHVQALQELSLKECKEITAWLSVEEEENSLSKQSDGLLCIPLNLISSLKKITIEGCEDLTFYGSKDVFAGFTSLEELTIWGCPKLLPSLVHKDGNDDQANGRWLLPQSLVQLDIDYSPETLQPCFPGNLTFLKRLQVSRSPSLKFLQLHSCTALEKLTIDKNESLEFLQLHSRTALEELTIEFCGSLVALEGLHSLGNPKALKVSCNGSLKFLQLHSCTALEKLTIDNCGSLAALEGLQSLGNLKAVKVSNNRSLKSLQVHSCTALEELTIKHCGSLAALDGLQTLSGLMHLEVSYCPRLNLSRQQCLGLQTLKIDDPSALTTSFCKHLTSLQRLELRCPIIIRDVISCLTDEQEEALQLLTSLQELKFVECQDLIDLPAGLHSLRSLKRLVIYLCRGISRLPEKGLPPSLEQLEITLGSKELNEHCRMLATSKLKVQIDWKYMN